MEKKKEQLRTKRLTLKAYDECDRQQMVDLCFNEEIKKTYMIPDFDDPKQAEKLFEKMRDFSRSDHHFVYGVYFDNTLIGFVNDCIIEDSMIEIGYVIIPDYQGQGFATEAVQACIEELFRMGFAHVRAGFFEENIASCRVMQKCGMHQIDLEEDIEYKGTLHHCLYYEIDNPMNIINLTDDQLSHIEDGLEAFDQTHMTAQLEGSIQIGIEKDGRLVAGLDACMTAFKILYVSTVFVEESHRRKGYGHRLMAEMERRAKELGANTIRLDTFSWQGKEFYEALGYQIVGHYENETDGYAEYFFLKRI